MLETRTPVRDTIPTAVRGNLRVQSMEKDGVPPNSVTYNTAIRACGDAGALEEALVLLDEMEAKGMKLTVVTYGTAVSACQRRGDWQTVSFFALGKEEEQWRVREGFRFSRAPTTVVLGLVGGGRGVFAPCLFLFCCLY